MCADVNISPTLQCRETNWLSNFIEMFTWMFNCLFEAVLKFDDCNKIKDLLLCYHYFYQAKDRSIFVPWWGCEIDIWASTVCSDVQIFTIDKHCFQE